MNNAIAVATRSTSLPSVAERNTREANKNPIHLQPAAAVSAAPVLLRGTHARPIRIRFICNRPPR